MPRQSTSRIHTNSENNPRADAHPKIVVADIFASVGRVFSSAKFATALGIAAMIAGGFAAAWDSLPGAVICLMMIVFSLWLEGRARGW